RLVGLVAEGWHRRQHGRLIPGVGAPVDVTEGGALLSIGDDQELPGLDVAAAGRLDGRSEAGDQVRLADRVGRIPAHRAGGHDPFDQVHVYRPLNWGGRFSWRARTASWTS